MNILQHIEQVHGRQHPVGESLGGGGKQRLAQSPDTSLLRGRILRLLSGSLAEVELPMGKKKAYIGGMHPVTNVDLLFQVRQRQEGARLWLHVAGITSAAPLSAREMLEALELPVEPLYQRLLDNLRQMQPFVLKEDLEQLFRLAAYVQQQLPAGEQVTPRALVELYQLLGYLRVRPTPELVSLLLPLLRFSLSELTQWLLQYRTILQSMTGSRDLKGGKHEEAGKSSTLLQAVQTIVPVLSEETAPSPLQLFSLQGLVAVMEEQGIPDAVYDRVKALLQAEITYNVLAWSRGLPIQWTGVLWSGKRHLPVRLTFERQQDQSDPDNPVSFSVELHLATLGSVAVEGTVVRQAITLHFWTVDAKTQQLVAARSSQLQQRLQRIGFRRVILEVRTSQERTRRRSYQHLNIVL